MSISNELMLAILAMDAYNRGYNSGLVGPGENKDTGLGITGFIGNAEIKTVQETPAAQAASFFAISYTWNGQTVISYRGTDQPAADVDKGYGTGAGAPVSDQSILAVEFYQSVVAATLGRPSTTSDLQAANVTLTGHSLGGGLAGFVGRLGKASSLH